MKAKASMSSAVVIPLRRIAIVMLGLMPLAVLHAQQSKAPPLTAAQKARIQERNRLIAQANALARQGETAKAITAAEGALAIEREVYGDSHRSVAESLQFLARQNTTAGNFDAARRSWQEAQTIWTRVYGAQDWRVADARSALAELDQRARMTPAQRQKLAEMEKSSNKAANFYREGRYAEAVPLQREIVTQTRDLFGENNPLYATKLNSLALSLAQVGDYKTSRSLLEQAVAITKATQGEHHPEYARKLKGLASLTLEQGDAAGARPLFEQILQIVKATQGERHTDYAIALNNLAETLERQGDDVAARPLLERALEVYKATEGPRSANYAISLNNLGSLLKRQGDLAGARPRLEQSLLTIKDKLGEKHPLYASYLNNLADVLREQGDFAAARPLYEQALKLTKATQGERDPIYAIVLNNLAALFVAQRDFTAAKPLYEQALELTKAVQGERHPEYANTLNNLALLLGYQGDLKASQSLREQSLALRKEVLGEHHPHYAESLNNLAWVLSAQGDDAGALRYEAQALDIYQELITRSLPTLPERQRLAMLASFEKLVNSALNMSFKLAGRDAEIYGRLLFWKGLAGADDSAQRLAAAPAEVREQAAELNELRSQLTKLYYAPVSRGQTPEHALRARALTDRIATLEVSLARSLGGTAAPVTPAQVAAALPQNAAFIDLIQYHQDTKAGKPESRYAAFVTRAGGSPRRVELGPAAPLERAIAVWRGAVQSGMEPDGKAMVDLVWKPLMPHLQGVDTVLVSPDGYLNFFPFGALADPDRPGTYLLERYAFGMVTSARLLVEPSQGRDAPSAVSLLVLGDVDYRRGDFGGGSRPTGTAHVPGRWAPVTDEIWSPLPGTGAEARSVAELCGRLAHGKVDQLTGPQATKDRLRGRLPGHRYLHLATHGYFSPPSVASALEPPQTANLGVSWLVLGRDDVAGLHPGLLSGLVCAGANAPPRDAATGMIDVGASVLTAEEVAGLDLSGCRLAVLSACETGLGNVAGGQGVLGLQRAFHRAGAGAVMASLWSVDDAATSLMMEDFYAHLWGEKLTPMEAMRRAQRTILDHPEKVDQKRAALATVRGAETKGPKAKAAPPKVKTAKPRRSTPDLWAAFVLSGGLR